MLEFKAIIDRLTTCRDGGFKITLDISETDAVEFAKAVALRGQVVKVTIAPSEQ